MKKAHRSRNKQIQKSKREESIPMLDFAKFLQTIHFI